MSSTVNVVELPFHDRLLKGNLTYCARTLGVASLVFAGSDDRKMLRRHPYIILISEEISSKFFAFPWPSLLVVVISDNLFYWRDQFAVPFTIFTYWSTRLTILTLFVISESWPLCLVLFMYGFINEYLGLFFASERGLSVIGLNHKLDTGSFYFRPEPG